MAPTPTVAGRTSTAKRSTSLTANASLPADTRPAPPIAPPHFHSCAAPVPDCIIAPPPSAPRRLTWIDHAQKTTKEIELLVTAKDAGASTTINKIADRGESLPPASSQKYAVREYKSDYRDTIAAMKKGGPDDIQRLTETKGEREARAAETAANVQRIEEAKKRQAADSRRRRRNGRRRRESARGGNDRRAATRSGGEGRAAIG